MIAVNLTNSDTVRWSPVII